MNIMRQAMEDLDAEDAGYRLATVREKRLSSANDGEGDCDCVRCANPNGPAVLRTIDHAFSGNCRYRPSNRSK